MSRTIVEEVELEPGRMNQIRTRVEKPSEPKFIKKTPTPHVQRMSESTLGTQDRYLTPESCTVYSKVRHN